ncbi:hypothetical protein [Sphingomonas lenta]|uniref:DUF2029 domain-containing protein n=1 Tax=Sphingomonas lenta TaxID=1141887 RepID=A0A2A2SIY6_9SPHN|nr:hypothetical protein [Sphingomonas lenta]PAX09237.1 hypothetical protein CKY28_00240 [Sphingomonas lenta]
MIREAKPFWLARPSRFAGWPRGSALLTLGVLLLGLLASLDALGADVEFDASAYAGAVETMRNGGEFHPALASSLRAAGEPVGLLDFAPPTLAVVAASLPGWALSALLFALAGAVFMAWAPQLQAATRGRGRWAAPLLLAAGLATYIWLSPVAPPALAADHSIYLRPLLLHAPEAWAGLFVALSLGLWARGGWLEAAAFGLAAGVVREVAGAYLLVMLLFALRTGPRREASAWALALAVLAGVVAVHWRAVGGEFGPLDRTSVWEFNGLGAFVQALAQASPLSVLPLWLAAPVIVLAAFGWIARSAPVALRVATTLAALAALHALAPGADAGWAYLIAALLLVGLAFAPDGLRDLLRAAVGDRRRITVRRVVR